MDGGSERGERGRRKSERLGEDVWRSVDVKPRKITPSDEGPWTCKLPSISPNTMVGQRAGNLWKNNQLFDPSPSPLFPSKHISVNPDEEVTPYRSRSIAINPGTLFAADRSLWIDCPIHTEPFCAFYALPTFSAFLSAIFEVWVLCMATQNKNWENHSEGGACGWK